MWLLSHHSQVYFCHKGGSDHHPLRWCLLCVHCSVAAVPRKLLWWRVCGSSGSTCPSSQLRARLRRTARGRESASRGWQVQGQARGCRGDLTGLAETDSQTREHFRTNSNSSVKDLLFPAAHRAKLNLTRRAWAGGAVGHPDAWWANISDGRKFPRGKRNPPLKAFQLEEQGRVEGF